MELGTIIDIHFAVPDAVEKLFIEASASATERQWTMTSQLLSLPGADSRDKKPERFSI